MAGEGEEERVRKGEEKRVVVQGLRCEGRAEEVEEEAGGYGRERWKCEAVG